MQEPCPAAMEIHFKQKKHLIKLKIKIKSKSNCKFK